jgi:2-polyprenyl-6-methoxyphenol hydroxylase-like FAD-dependent oxidoreductase
MRRVLVVGAGIAGPALAFWLTRTGVDVTVVEKAPRPRPGGQAVDLRGPAREVAVRMGLHVQIRRAGLRTPDLCVVDADGNVRTSVRAEDAHGDGRIAEIEILRGDLARVLRDATSRDARYVFGTRATGLQEASDGVTVTFAQGEPQRYDLVIGADGLHSEVRASVFGEDPGCVRHLGVYVAYWSAPNHLGLEDRAVAHEDAGRSVGIRPVRGNREAIVYVAFRSPELALAHGDVAAQKQLVREHAAGMRWEVPTLLAGLDDAPDFHLDPCSQVVLDSWSRGRVGLLGDAASSPSPLTGQGTSLALVGAYVLAGELAAAGGDVAAGLAAYEQRLRPWTERTQQMGREGADDTTLHTVATSFTLPEYPRLRRGAP